MRGKVQRAGEKNEISRRRRLFTAGKRCINKYMVFWDTNKTKHSELHDSVVENLIKLKHQYSLYNKYYVDSNMKVYKPKIGMTKNEVMAFTKYIAPEDINKTTTKSSISEQYCYSNGDYLYFENGILSTIQE